jgi:hypothetical protein
LPLQLGVQHAPFTHEPLEHVPQETSLPQLSILVPHLAVPQVASLLTEMQPHSPGVPPPPQVCPVPEQLALHDTE